MSKNTEYLNQKATVKTEAVFALVDKGMPLDKAYKTIRPDKELTTSGMNRLKQKYKQHTLTQPKIVKSAIKAVTDTINMVEVNGVMPSVTNRLTAAQMVLDRAEPIITKNLNINANLDISPVDLTKYVDNL